MRGVLLLQHRSFPTVKDLANQYYASSEDRGFWFASFTWASIADTDKKDLQLIRAGLKRVQGKKKKQVASNSFRACARSMQNAYNYRVFRDFSHRL
jgi:hypothetical protein